jgi:hypothetical protein
MDVVKQTTAQARSWQSPIPYPPIPNGGLDENGQRPTECLLCSWYGGRLKYVSQACFAHGDWVTGNV